MRDCEFLDGWEVPKYREAPWYPALDPQGNIIWECYVLPLGWVEIKPIHVRQHIKLHLFVVEIFGVPVECAKIEFPTLDASNTENEVALVKLYRAKMEVKEQAGVSE